MNGPSFVAKKINCKLLEIELTKLKNSRLKFPNNYLLVKVKKKKIITNIESLKFVLIDFIRL